MQFEPFSKEYSIHYYEIDKKQKATPVAILNFLEDTAISHSNSVGLSINRLKSDKVGWVLSRWNVKINAYPSLFDKISVETWPSGFQRFYANREFLIKDSNKQVIAKASSLWIFLNIETRHPTRIPKEFGDIYGIWPSRATDEPFSDLENNISFDSCKDFTVSRKDLDTNEHVNNVRYIEWFLETIPDDVYNNFILSSLEVNYKKEIKSGITISSASKELFKSPEHCEYSHIITSPDGSMLYSSAKTTWIKA